MVYAWSNLWLLVIGATAATLLPIAALCGVLAALRPVPRAFLDAVGLVGDVAVLGAVAVGLVISGRSLAAMRAAAALVDPDTARELWERGWLEAVAPAAAGVGVALAFALLMRFAKQAAPPVVAEGRTARSR